MSTDMKTKVGTKGILLKYNKEKQAANLSVVEIGKKSDVSKFASLIEADLIDVAEYNQTYDIVVDDEGLLVEGNPVFKIQTPYGPIHLAGNLLILKKKYEKDGVDLVGLTAGEVLNLFLELNGKITLIGYTRG
jgi:hypothetical protein